MRTHADDEMDWLGLGGPSGRLYPEDFFEVCDKAEITRAAFIQNGIDDFRQVPLDEAVTRFMAIRNFELAWDSNPFLIAESFFNPNFDLEKFRKLERAFVTSFLSGLKDIFLVSSSDHSHYKLLEDYKHEASLKPITASAKF